MFSVKPPLKFRTFKELIAGHFDDLFSHLNYAKSLLISLKKVQKVNCIDNEVGHFGHFI